MGQTSIETYRDVTAQRRLERTLTAIYYLGQELILTRDEEKITRAVVNAARQVLRFQVCSLMLLQKSNLIIVASSGYGQSLAGISMPLKSERGVVATVARSGELLYAPDVSRDPRYVVGGEFQAQSELAVPLKVGGQVIGVLNVESNQLDAFDTTDLQLLTTLADVAAVALESARAYQAEQQQAAETTILYRMGAALVTERDPAAIASRIFVELDDLLGIETAAVCLVDRAANELMTFGVDQKEPFPPRGLPLEGNSLSAYMVRTGKPLRIDDLNTADLPVPGILIGELPHAWLGAPLQVEDRIIGALIIQSYQPRPFGPEVEKLLIQIAAQVAPVLENARLYQAEQRRVEEMAALGHITRRLAGGLTFPQLFQDFVPDLQVLVPCDRVSIALVDDPTEPTTFTMYAIHDRPDAPLGEGVTLPLTATAAAADSLAGRPHLTPDLATELDLPAEKALYASGLRSRVNLPLMAGGRGIGALNLGSRTPGAFREEQLPLLQQVADAVAAATENTRLYQAAQEHATQLETKVRKRTAELQAERDRTQAILDSAAEGVIVTDLEGAILYVNPAMERLTGYSAAEMLGQDPSLWESGQHPSEFFQRMWKMISEGKIWEDELTNKRKDGTLYDAKLTVAPIPGPDGRPVGYVGIQNDISHLKELDRMKDRFVSNVSHELRTPLTNLKIYLNLLEKGRPEKRGRYMDTLHREANRLQQLIEDLLDLSRLDVGSRQVNRVPVNLNRLVRQLVEDRTALAIKRGLELTDELDPDLPSTLADEKMLMQVITNLTTNAMNYTPAGGRVTVRTGRREEQEGKEREEWVFAQVRDTGMGIAPQEQEHLFERFYRGAAAQRIGASGTGLGLAICKEIVGRHEGRITVESEVGKGSTFTVWLPVLNAQERTTEAFTVHGRARLDKLHQADVALY